MNTKVYKLKALTNIHVGSSDLSYGIVDKLIQRDPVSRFPVIHASSMKGSLKEYCENMKIHDRDIKTYIEQIFGSDTSPGENKFFSSHLLSIPVRSNKRPFFRATCPAIIIHLMESINAFGLDKRLNQSFNELLTSVNTLHNLSYMDFVLFQSKIHNMVIEDWSKQDNVSEFTFDPILIQWLGDQKDFVLLNDSVFMDICENLPIVARNNLSEKRNLWYEELVPRQSEFWFFHIYPNIDVIEDIINQQTPVQIGANASVGDGYCVINTLNTIYYEKS